MKNIPTRGLGGAAVLAAFAALLMALALLAAPAALSAAAVPADPPELVAQSVAAGIYETGLVPDMPAGAKCPAMTLHFGSRLNRSGKARSANHGAYHAGVDWALPVGTPILAIADGEVFARRADLDKSTGNHVIIRHSREFSSTYTHLSAFNVEEGQSVSKGQVIGFLGQTGRNTTYAHLHLNIYGRERMQVGNRTWRYRYDYLQFLSGDMSPIDPVKKRKQKVKVAYMDRAGKIHPADAKVIWPFVCG